MKKNYQKPNMKVLYLKTQGRLLAGSGDYETGYVPGMNIGEGLNRMA